MQRFLKVVTQAVSDLGTLVSSLARASSFSWVSIGALWEVRKAVVGLLESLLNACHRWAMLPSSQEH